VKSENASLGAIYLQQNKLQ